MKFSPKKYFATVLTAFLLCLIRPLSGLGAIVNVSVANNSFAPATANINAGDKVIWTWAPNSFSHNVVSESTPSAWVFPNNNALQSTPFAFTNTFNSAGSFPYECTLHVSSGMVGTINVAAAANQPPIVTITNPTSGTVFIAPANVTVQASASDSNGTVTNVQFRIGSTVLTNKAAAPFSAVTNNLPAGSYTLSAIASDNLGAKTTNSVNIIVDAPPSVTITNPASGAVFTAPANVTVQASASDSDGTVTNVQFLIGSTVLTNKTTAPFSAVTNNLPAGSYTLSAIASDNNGVKATNAVTVSVVTPVPVALTAPQRLSAINFQFSYSANVGLNYVVQRSTNLLSTNWVAIITNTAGSSSMIFVDSNATLNPGFYRVGRLPNP